LAKGETLIQLRYGDTEKKKKSQNNKVTKYIMHCEVRRPSWSLDKDTDKDTDTDTNTDTFTVTVTFADAVIKSCIFFECV